MRFHVSQRRINPPQEESITHWLNTKINIIFKAKRTRLLGAALHFVATSRRQFAGYLHGMLAAIKTNKIECTKE